MKMQKSVIYVKKTLKMNMLKIKKFNKVRDHCHYTGEYKGAADSTCSLKYSVPKEISIVSHNGCSDDYHFIIKRVSRKI